MQAAIDDLDDFPLVRELLGENLLMEKKKLKENVKDDVKEGEIKESSGPLTIDKALTVVMDAISRKYDAKIDKLVADRDAALNGLKELLT